MSGDITERTRESKDTANWEDNSVWGYNRGHESQRIQRTGRTTVSGDITERTRESKDTANWEDNSVWGYN